MEEKTALYKTDKFKEEEVKIVLEEVIKSLTERNYNAYSQLVGYLMSGDPGYISSYQDARRKITSIDRSVGLDYLIRKSLGGKK